MKHYRMCECKNVVAISKDIGRYKILPFILSENLTFQT